MGDQVGTLRAGSSFALFAIGFLEFYLFGYLGAFKNFVLFSVLGCSFQPRAPGSPWARGPTVYFQRVLARYGSLVTSGNHIFGCLCMFYSNLFSKVHSAGLREVDASVDKRPATTSLQPKNFLR